MDNSETKYIPGECNIGKEQVDRRIRFGWIGFVMTIGLWGTFILFRVPAIFRITLFVPAFVSALGFLQGLMHFCVYFALKGIYNMKSKSSKNEIIMWLPLMKKDKRRARELLVYTILIAMVVAMIAYFSVK